MLKEEKVTLFLPLFLIVCFCWYITNKKQNKKKASYFQIQFWKQFTWSLSETEHVYQRTCPIAVPSIHSQKLFVLSLLCCPIRAMSHSKLPPKMQRDWWEMKKKEVTRVLPWIAIDSVVWTFFSKRLRVKEELRMRFKRRTRQLVLIRSDVCCTLPFFLNCPVSGISRSETSWSLLWNFNMWHQLFQRSK